MQLAQQNRGYQKAAENEEDIDPDQASRKNPAGQAVAADNEQDFYRNKQISLVVGSTPLVEGNNLIVNVGAPHGPCVAAFDLKTGRMAWGASSGEPAWGPSYASPIPAVVNGKRRVFVALPGFTADCLETIDEIGSVAP